MTLVPSFVSGLFVYPVKGCRGIPLGRARLEARGLRHDRRWAIVDETGTTLTQRNHPRLALVDVAIEDASLVLSPRDAGAPALRLPMAPSGPRRSVTVWHDTVDAIDAGEEAARWATQLLGISASVVHMPDDVRRAAKPAYARPDDIVGFADAFPLLLATTASLADLNARMERPLPMDRFRPNVVVDGCAPWAEDAWTRVRIGDLPVRVVKPCDRCVVTTTDQQTGERGVEPLRTLATFRKRGNDVFFAVNGVPDAEGDVAVGDRFIALG
jgi:uncharacterized protein YcbX